MRKPPKWSTAVLLVLGMLAGILSPVPVAQAVQRTPPPRPPSSPAADFAVVDGTRIPARNNCEEVKRLLKARAEKGDARGAFCHDTAEPTKASRAAATKALAIIEFPKWCLDNAEGNIWRYEHRRLACRWLPDQLIRLMRYANGTFTEVGQVWYAQADLITISPTLPQFAHQQQIAPFNLTGEAQSGVTVSGGFSCEGWCTYGAQDYPLQTLTTNTLASGSRVFGTTVSAPGTQGGITTRLTNAIGKPGYTLGYVYIHGAPVRCDNDVPGLSVGCVHPEHPPTFDLYSLTEPGGFPELARHIKSAQDSGLPGAPGGSPLHRTNSELLRNRNNSRACPPGTNPGWQRPLGKDCDEYPFQSTYEGAWAKGQFVTDTSPEPPGPWPGRTFNFCDSIPLPIWTPGVDPPSSLGFSSCFIDSSVNQAGGNALRVWFYQPERVLDRDAFFVEVRP
jgi:hypothetical protein